MTMEQFETNETGQLIQEIKKGLLNWYDLKQGSTVLYLGGKEDSYPHIWLEKNMEVVCALPKDTVNPQWSQEHNGKFDCLLAVCTLETEKEPKKFLKAWKELLKPTGVLLLGMNNRFGLKYFCGDRDPYTERNFDGIEGYRRVYSNNEDNFMGRCYSKGEIRSMLENTGWEHIKFYSVLSDLDNPRLIYAENYLPNEDLSNRLFPTYHYPNTVFLEEEGLYDGLIKNGMFHVIANSYVVECPMDGKFSDVIHVTSSMERGREAALLTIIHGSGIVEKRAPYEEGRKRLERLIWHSKELADHRIPVIEARMEKDSCVMEYREEESGQLYLKRLLYTDREKFFTEMDHFRDMILQSSEIVRPDRGDGEGAILKKGYLDMVPLNSFHIHDTFVFYDQEFCEEDYPANEIIWRMVATFYAGYMEDMKVLPRDLLLERYGLMKNLRKWQKMEWDFLGKLRKEKELDHYHRSCWRNGEVVYANRQRMNYSVADYERLFVDIFRHADSRKLILFGSGTFAKKFLALYGRDYPVYWVVDNKKENWGKELEGIPIEPPKRIKELESGEYKVLICIKNYISVMKQLEDMGVREYSIYDAGKDYPRRSKPAGKPHGGEAGGDKKSSTTHKKFHVGYIAGVFDLFHIGHLNMFKRAKEQCDYLIVGVVTDEGVRKYKKTEAFVPFEERIEMVRACRYVDEAVDIPLNYGGTRDAHKLLHFDCQFSGSDYEDNPDWMEEKKYLEEHGAQMVFFPYTEGTSSSKIKELIEKRLC